jgi:hypothetical protein
VNLRQDHAYLDAVLSQGAQKARSIAKPMMEKFRRRIGMRRKSM